MLNKNKLENNIETDSIYVHEKYKTIIYIYSLWKH